MAVHNFAGSNDMTYTSNTLADVRADIDKLNPLHAQFNPNNPDFQMAESLALESLRIAGAWVTVLPRTDDRKYDPVWNEDASPTYYAGYDFKAYFQPQPPEIALTKFGHDAPTTVDLRFGRSDVLSTMGERLIRIGDVIVVPHNSLIIKATRFQVKHVGEIGNYRYRWFYLDVTCENMNHDDTLVPLIA